MRLTNKGQLTFGKMADEWAREVASTPGALDRDDILLELIRAVWRGEFEDDHQPGEPKSCLTIPHPKVVRGDGAFLDERRHRTDTPPLNLWNRRKLLAAMPPIAGVPLPPKSELWPIDSLETFPWKNLKPSIPFDALAALNLDEYEDLYRRTYLEALTVSKDHFGRWCDDHGHAHPAFWFGDEAAGTAVSTTVPSRDDETGKRIQAVLEAAAEKSAKNQYLSIAEIANLLAMRDTTEKFLGYGYESIRKILSGTFGPAKRRGIRGLGA